MCVSRYTYQWAQSRFISARDCSLCGCSEAPPIGTALPPQSPDEVKADRPIVHCFSFPSDPHPVWHVRAYLMDKADARTTRCRLITAKVLHLSSWMWTGGRQTWQLSGLTLSYSNRQKPTGCCKCRLLKHLTYFLLCFSKFLCKVFLHRLYKMMCLRSTTFVSTSWATSAKVCWMKVVDRVF